MTNGNDGQIMNFIIALILLTFASVVHSQDTTYFRYKNDQGVLVMSDAIPIKYASKGYEIVDIYGRVTKLVPPEPSEDEKARLRKAYEEKERLAKWDRELKLRYSHVEDILAAKKRRLRGIDTSIFTLKLTLNNIADRINTHQADAAASERQGKVVPQQILSSIEQLQKDKQLIGEEIHQKQLDKVQITQEYDKNIVRFKEITTTNNQ